MSKATVKERQFAEAFLREVGADIRNIYLVTAVVAWMRQESGQHYIGNNVFNIRNSKLASGYRQSKGNGHFAIFASLAIAAKATALFLVGNSRSGYGYDKVLAALRRSNDNTVKGEQKQGIDFLAALAMSKWDAAHYGAPHGEPWLNHLIKTWATITGLPPIPAEKNQTSRPAPRARPTPLHGNRNPDLQKGVYIEPHAAQTFYEARHAADEPLPGGL
jgi:hypothetical protein